MSIPSWKLADLSGCYEMVQLQSVHSQCDHKNIAYVLEQAGGTYRDIYTGTVCVSFHVFQKCATMHCDRRCYEYQLGCV